MQAPVTITPRTANGMTYPPGLGGMGDPRTLSLVWHQRCYTVPMADTEQSPGAFLHIKAANVQAIRDLYREMREARRSRLEWASSILERSMRLNENGASFYEKWMLLDAGTIALSVTFLGGLLSHTPGGHLPTQPILCLVCPAWALLLTSIYCCWMSIASFHKFNKLLLEGFCAVLSDYELQYLGILMERASGALQGEIKLETEQIDFSKLLVGMGAWFKSKASDEACRYGALIQTATESDQKTTPYKRIAFWSMILAFILLCIFAVKALLLV